MDKIKEDNPAWNFWECGEFDGGKFWLHLEKFLAHEEKEVVQVNHA